MNRDEKQAAVKEIGSELESASAIFAVDYRGISVPQAAELRSRLSEADASFTIVKNRLAKRITAETGTEALDEHLVGPTALTYVKGDAVVAAKAITGFAREHEVLAFKGGIMDGKPLDPDQFRAISRLPGLDVLHGQLVGLAASPLSGLVSSLNGLIQGLASQLGQISEQGLVGAEASEAEAAPEAEAEPEPEERVKEGEPAPGTGGEDDAEAPAEEAGDSDNPGGSEEVLPDEGEAPDAGEPAGDEEPAVDAEPQTEGEDEGEATSEQADESDQGDDSESDADEN